MTLIHYPDIRSKRKGDFPFSPMTLEGGDDILQKGGARFLWEALEASLDRKVSSVSVEIASAQDTVRIIAYLNSADVALLSATIVNPVLLHWLRGRGRQWGESPYINLSLDAGGSGQGTSSSKSPWSNIVATVKRHKPKGFDPVEIQREKDKYFKWSSPSEAILPTDDEAFATKVRAYKASAKSTKPADSTTFEETFKAIEEQVGTPIPNALRILHSEVSCDDSIFHGQTLLTPEELLREWQLWRDIYVSWSLSDLKSHVTASRNIVFPVYTCPRWLPFLKVDGNFLCLDLSPGKKGHYGQVIAMGEDLDRRALIASSLDEWLDFCEQTLRGIPVQVLP